MKLPIGAALLAMFLAPPVAAQNACVNTIAGVTETLTEQGVEYVLLPQDIIPSFVANIATAVTGLSYEGVNVTNVIIAEPGGKIAFGLEIDGCLTDPIYLKSRKYSHIPKRGW